MTRGFFLFATSPERPPLQGLIAMLSIAIATAMKMTTGTDMAKFGCFVFHGLKKKMVFVKRSW